MSNKKVAIIGTVGIPANYGGFETLTEHLVEELGTKLDFSVYCTTKKYKKEDRLKTYKDARLIYLPFRANGLQSIVYDCLSILHAIFYADVLLVLGVSGGFLIPFVRLFTNKKIIVSIDGMEWKRNKWNKWARWYLWASEWLAVKYSHANIADNESIQDYTAIRYKVLSNIIEYGADHVMHVMPTEKDHAKYSFLSGAYAIKVCRIEPENNIDIVLEAFSRLNTHKLVLIGNWKNSEYGIKLRDQYSHYSNLYLLDPIYNQREIDLLRGNATVYIHGHSAGGTNPSLVEAMYLKLPVVAYNVMYNRTTTENSALYFKNVDDLVTIIKGKRVKDLKVLGERMKAIADRRYTWQVIANKYYFLVKAVSDYKVATSLQARIANDFNNKGLVQQGLSHLKSASFFYEKR